LTYLRRLQPKSHHRPSITGDDAPEEQIRPVPTNVSRRHGRSRGFHRANSTLDALIAVDRRGRALEEALAEEVGAELDPRDRGFARALVTTAIRRRGQMQQVA